MAVSFTRAATRNLTRHRAAVVGAIGDVVASSGCDPRYDHVRPDAAELFRVGLLHWPNGHTTATYTTVGRRSVGRPGTARLTRLSLSARRSRSGGVSLRSRAPRFRQRSVSRYSSKVPVRMTTFVTCSGRRSRSQQSPHLSASAFGRVCASLVVDEVFDANDLDITVIEAAINAGVAVTLVGDPWQALYVFRGARPEVVPLLLQRTSVRTLSLTHSFRWKSPEQRELAERLRASAPATLPVQDHARDLGGVDVVLALMWETPLGTRRRRAAAGVLTRSKGARRKPRRRSC